MTILTVDFSLIEKLHHVGTFPSAREPNIKPLFESRTVEKIISFFLGVLLDLILGLFHLKKIS